MADGQFGGNGSVHWSVDADEGTTGFGVDYEGNRPGRGDEFVIRVKLPANDAGWLARLRQANPVDGVLEFRLPIENTDAPATQIRVLWGRQIPAGMGDRLAERKKQART